MDQGSSEDAYQSVRGMPAAASEELLPRELAVLQLAAQGLTAEAVAERLRLSRRVVEELLRRCAWRLGAADLQAAILLARHAKLIE